MKKGWLFGVLLLLAGGVLFLLGSDFFVSAGALILSGVALFPIPAVRRQLKRKGIREGAIPVFAALLVLVAVLYLPASLFGAADAVEPDQAVEDGEYSIPAYSDSPFVTVNGNKPVFSEKELKKKGYESYGELDFLGRVGVAVASLGKETMPEKGEERESISEVRPSGWVQKNYDFISGEYLYNRAHLIGWQLSAENVNERNLLTGTRYFNTEGMLPFENMVADYIKETGNHVAYRITPVFKGNELVCRGVRMEAFSVEDEGEGISFHVFVYNVQPGVVIDYLTGESCEGEKNATLLDLLTNSLQSF